MATAAGAPVQARQGTAARGKTGRQWCCWVVGRAAVPLTVSKHPLTWNSVHGCSDAAHQVPC